MNQEKGNKKILHVVSVSFSLPYFIGDQFDHFREQGWEMFVACSPSEHLSIYAAEKRFTVFSIQINRTISPLADIKAIFKLYKAIKSAQIDIVFGHTPKGGMVAMIAAFLAGSKKRVYVRHGLMYETSKGLKRALLKTIERITGFFAKKVVCVSNSILKVSNAGSLSSPKKNVLLGLGTFNGIDTVHKYAPQNIDKHASAALRASLRIDSDDLVIGFVGRLVVDKGIEDLICAWDLLKNRYSKIKLLLVGPFEERDAVCEEVKSTIRTDYTIVHTGLVSNPAAYYAIMDIFVLPSYREGLPTVIIEASSLGIPVVATRVTGCVDAVLPEKTGLLTSHYPEDIAANLSRYIENSTLRFEHGENGRNFVVSNFDQTNMWSKIEQELLHPIL